MSVQSLFARISSLVIDHSLGQLSGGKRRLKSTRQQSMSRKFSQVVEEMEQRILLAGAEEEPHNDVTTYSGFKIAADSFPGFDSSDFNDLPQASAGAAQGAAGGNDPDNPLSNSYVFAPEDIMFLNSNPGATKTIYLDFDGQITNDPSGVDQTGWNGGQRIDSRPYDIDGDIFTFNDQELSNIYDIWRRVSEDFRPFNVNVTTQEPADLDDLRRQSIPGTIINLASPGVDEENGSQIDAIETNLVSGSTARAIGMNIGDGAFGTTSGDYDWYAVRGVQAGSVISVDIDAESIGSTLDSYVTIYDSFGNIVADNDDVDGFDSVIAYEAAISGDYFVVVSGATGGGKEQSVPQPEALLVGGAQDDPLDPSSGAGVNSTGDYNIDISLDIDDSWGIRVVIAGDSGEWLSPDFGIVGGIAFVGSFNSRRDNPTFVFQSNLGGLSGAVNGISEAISHEVGHTMGLDHDGLIQFNTTTGVQVPNWEQTYYPGHGSGVNSWGPIMGAAFSRSMTQWSSGEYFSGPLSRDPNPDTGRRHYQYEANNSVPFGSGAQQDDLSIIVGGNGFGYRVDDYGDTLATATPLTEVTPSSFYDTGIITKRTDLDWFSFSVPQLSGFEVTGVDIRVNPAALRPNLDLAVDLFNSAGQLITFSSPEGRLDGTITFVLDPGETYYLRVDGVGFKNVSIGYSDYGSLGYYEVELDYFEPIIFNDQAFSVLENSAVGTSVGTLVSGQAPIDSIIYEIIGGNTNNTFAVDSFTGELTVNDPALLDFEANPVFNLTVRVTDQGRSVVYSDTATVTINVLDGPEAPVIADQTFIVPENSINGTSVGTVIATDPDPARILSYAILGGTGSTVFQINSATGEISVSNSAALNFEVNTTFDLLVEAVNDAATPLGSTATITVNVGDVNELPVINNTTLPNLDEHAPDGTSVGTVTGTDVDAGQTLTYSIIAGNPGGDGFAINPVTGEITVNNTLSFNFNANPNIILTVQATDDGTPQLNDTAFVFFNLIDTQGTPIVNDQAFQVPELSPVGTSVGFVAGFDPDPTDTLSFGPFLSGNTGNTFAIDSVTGEITVADPTLLVLATNPTFSLNLFVSDDGTPSLFDTAIITVNLTPFNNPPVLNDFNFSVEERGPVGTVVGTVAGSDVDVIDTLSYSIISGNDLGGFAINSTTGEITIADPAVVDFSRNKVFNLTVQVDDDGFPIKSDTAAVTITVLEFNGPIRMSDQEQYLLELINRARLDPLAEAARLGLDQAQTDLFVSLGTDAVQPLAGNEFLVRASVDHSVDMLTRNFFGHVNPDGDSFDVRAFDAGFDFNLLAENLDLLTGTTGLDQATIQLLHDRMILNPIKRLNLLDGVYREFGAGIRDDVGLNATVVTDLLAREDATGAFITGVVFTDASDGSANDDDFYSIGEAVRSGRVRATNQTTGEVFEREIGDSGAFSLRVPDGTYDVIAFGGGLGTDTFAVRDVVVSGQNEKVDFEVSSPNALTPSVGISGFEDGNWWVSTQNGGTWQTSVWGQFPVSTLKASVSGDFNGDGLDDVAGWANDGNWYLGLGQSNGSLAVSQWNGWVGNDATEVNVGDFNGDGLDDLVVRDSGGFWSVAESQGNTFTTQTWGKWNANSNWKDIKVGDFNNDGKDDIIGRAQSGQLTVGLSNGTKFNSSKWGQWSKAVTWQDVSVGDFNGDGRADITGRANSGIWRTSLSQGNTFVTTSWKKWTTNGNWNDVVVGDFDGDGRDDIAGRRDSNKWWIGISKGTSFRTAFWGKWDVAENWSDVVVADFNADGYDDISARNSVGQWDNLISQGSSFLNELGPVWNSALNWTSVFAGSYIGPVTSASPPAAPAAFAVGGSSSSPASGSQAGPSLVYEADDSSGDQTTNQKETPKAKQSAPAASPASDSSDSLEELFGDSDMLDLLYQV